MYKSSLSRSASVSYSLNRVIERSGITFKNLYWIILKNRGVGRAPLRHNKKSIKRALRYSVFNSGRPLIQWRPLRSCFTAPKRFLLFKGPGSLKFFFLYWRKCRVIKGLSIDTTPTPPFVPLDSTFNGRNKTFIKCDESLNHIYVNYDENTHNSFFMEFLLIFGWNAEIEKLSIRIQITHP
jgi:hypothetical protein